MARNKNMPAVAAIDMRGEVNLRTLPVGTFIVTVGPTKDVTHAEELTEQTLAGRRALIRDIPNYPIY